MRLMTRMTVVLAVTALVWYFDFLHGKRPAHDEVQPVDDRITYSPASQASGLSHLAPVIE
jgi:hypothetical protein